MKNNVVKIRVSGELFIELLGFPKDCSIENIALNADINDRNIITILLAGKDFKELLENERIPTINPEFRKEENGKVVFVRWDHCD
jgi:hypothetical protein